VEDLLEIMIIMEQEKRLREAYAAAEDADQDENFDD
jgi:hypothetical protein